MKWQADVLVKGSAVGEVLRFDAPISFWGGICPETARVVMSGHPQCGAVIKDLILVLPDLIGSSSSSAVLLELLYRSIGPRALVLGASDAILPIGALVSEEMGWTSLPVLKLDHPPFATGDRLRLCENGLIEGLPS